MTPSQLSVFLAYTDRFDRIFRDLPLWFRKGDYSNADVQAALNKGAVYHAVIRFLNLVSEEHYLAKRDLVEKDVWALWQQNLDKMIASPLIAKVWRDVKHEYESQPDFSNYMDTKTKDIA